MMDLSSQLSKYGYITLCNNNPKPLADTEKKICSTKFRPRESRRKGTASESVGLSAVATLSAHPHPGSPISQPNPRSVLVLLAGVVVIIPNALVTWRTAPGSILAWDRKQGLVLVVLYSVIYLLYAHASVHQTGMIAHV